MEQAELAGANNVAGGLTGSKGLTNLARQGIIASDQVGETPVSIAASYCRLQQGSTVLRAAGCVPRLFATAESKAGLSFHSP